MDARAGAWRPVHAVLLAGSLGACQLNTSGLGTGGAMPGGGDETTTSEGSAGETSTGGGGSGQVEGDGTADPSNGAGDAPGSTGPTDDGDETTTGAPVDPCESPAPFTVEIDVTAALLSPPMQLDTDPIEGPYAYSEVANQGRASFEFQLPCQAEVRAWGRVYDPGVGASSLDVAEPDSFRIAFDGEDTIEWWFGCQMVDAAPYGGAWSWERVMDNPACFGEELRRTLSPGTHLLHVTNREAGDLAMDSVAGVARVVITSDPAYEP